jgi:hypothetical protein
VWVVFSHVSRNSSVDEEKLAVYELDKLGKRTTISFATTGASACLYDLTARKPAISPP